MFSTTVCQASSLTVHKFQDPPLLNYFVLPPFLEPVATVHKFQDPPLLNYFVLPPFLEPVAYRGEVFHPPLVR